MKNILSVLFLSVGLLLIAQAASAQRNPAAAADEAFENKKFVVAVERYKKAYTKVKNNDAERNRIIYQLGECYRLTNYPKRAEMQYKRLIRKDYQKERPELLLHFADALKANEKYNEAIEYYKMYAELIPEDPRGLSGIKSCEMINEWLDNPSKHQIESVKRLNSRESDFAPTYAGDAYNSIIFTSTREGSTGSDTDEWTDQNFSDLYVSRMDRKGEWSTPVLLDNSDGEGEDVINTKANEGAPTMNSDFSTLYFTRCPKDSEKGLSGCQIYKSERSGRSWRAPELLLLGNDTNAVVGHPTLSEDELIIYFSSRRVGGMGGNDIWVATREKASEEFGRPMNIGPVVNTPGNEMFPFLRYDTVLYFASDGHPGMGGLDLFKVTIDENGEWGQPVNLGVPLNSSGDDFAIIFKPGGEEGFFSTNRDSYRGYDGLYHFIIPPVEFTLSGTVKNERTLQFVEAVNVELVGSDGTSVATYTNDKGFYMFGKSQVLPNTTYELILSKEDYFNTTGTTTTVGLTKSTDLTRDFMLQPIPEEPIVLPEILYDLDKWALKPQYQDSLQGLIKTLDENETIVIELASHTDARASDEYNEILSQKRAQSVVNYLIDRGIDPDRLVAKGYGERVPRELKKDINRDGYLFEKGTVLTESYIDSLDVEDKREVAHQLNRRTEFRVLRKDFVPKPKPELDKDINIVMNPEDNVVKYTTDPTTGEIQTICTINGYSMQFTYEPDLNAIITLDKALELLNKGAISKDNFEGDPNQVLAEGSIANNAVFVVEEFTLGTFTVKDVKFTVSHRLRHPLMIGRSVLQQIGKFKINRDKQEIVFEVKE
ncbi:MAG: OmpA family protein [Bacteroidales bacterium]|nr:OmpA family protein [Bacteroidales bacterium]MCF8375076.1 OmpA family protein [Bacteroidales bacterium]MCF8399982.1 OmpA family protein [Bacteroidales bacterium]